MHGENEVSLLRPILIKFGRDMAEMYQYHTTINQSLNAIKAGFLCLHNILDTQHHPKDMIKMVKICKGVIYT